MSVYCKSFSRCTFRVVQKFSSLKEIGVVWIVVTGPFFFCFAFSSFCCCFSWLFFLIFDFSFNQTSSCLSFFSSLMRFIPAMREIQSLLDLITDTNMKKPNKSQVAFISALITFGLGFAVMVSDGESLRDEIKAGLHEGVSFPDPTAIKARICGKTSGRRTCC